MHDASNEWASLWPLDPAVAFLNHGSFGACPLTVLEAQRAWREGMEREPVRFLARELESLLDRARAELAAFVGADPNDLAFVPRLCAPKGSAFLHVRRDRQTIIRPLVISHGANSRRQDRSRFRLEFDWTGTIDPTAYLCVPDAIRFLGTRLPGGWPVLMARNRALALEARRVLCEALGVPPPSPDDMIGALAAVPLPDGFPEPPTTGPWIDPLHRALFDRFGLEVPVIPWPAAPKRVLRVSAQLYNTAAQYERLAHALVVLLGE